MTHQALFAGLIVNPSGQAVEVSQVGGRAQYVVPDGDFRFNVDAEAVDRQVLERLREQIEANRDVITEGTLKMLGHDDLFTKASIDVSLNHLKDNFEKLLEQGFPEEARAYLGMLGFRITINYHGEVVSVEQPGQIAPEDE